MTNDQPGVVINGIRYVTTAEAAEHLAPDVTAEMIRDWTKRGLLNPAGRLRGRSNVYRILDIANAEKRTRNENRGRKRRSGDLQKIHPSGQNLPTDLLANPARKSPICSIFDEAGDGCANGAYRESPFPICEDHIRLAYNFWEDLRREREAARAAEEQAQVEARLAALRPVKLLNPLTSYVYYLRFGDRYKIGVSTCVLRRLANLPHDGLVALEPGSQELESLRHKQFAASRVPRNREWFFPSPELDSHMNMLVAHYGTPEQVQARDGDHGPSCLNRPHVRQWSDED